MDFTVPTFEQVALAFLATAMIREIMIVALPDDIAGPGGWLIDTSPAEEEA